MRLSRTLAVVALAALLVSPLAAADKGKGDKGKGGEGAKGIINVPKSVELTAQQQEKLKALNEAYAPKFAAWKTKYVALLTPERLKAQKEAVKKAIAEGKDKNEVKRIATAALNLSDDERAKLQDLYKEMGQVKKEARAELIEILTDEQKAKLKSGKGKGVDKGGKGVDKGGKGSKGFKGNVSDKGAKGFKGTKGTKGNVNDKGNKGFKGNKGGKGNKPGPVNKGDKGNKPAAAAK